MITITMKKSISTLILFVLIFKLNASNNIQDSNIYNWGDDLNTAKSSWMFLQNAVDEKNYTIAVPKLHWLLKNTPDLNISLYISGAKILEESVKAEKDATRKITLQDSVLWLYDERIIRYGDEANVLNRKGRVAYKYLAKRRGNEEALFALYAKIFELNANSTLITNVTSYFKSAVQLFKLNKKPKEDIVNLFITVLYFFETKETEYTEQAKKLNMVSKNRKKVISIFDKNVQINCEEIQIFFTESFTQNPTLKKAKTINNLLAKKKCINCNLFIQTNDKILEAEPTSKRYSVAAKIFKQKGKLDISYEYFNKAIELEKNDTLKAKILLEQAEIEVKKGNLSIARKKAKESITLNSSNPIAFEFIGDLYFNSATNACTSSDVLMAKAVYIAAYNMYQKAGNTSKMNTAKAQFPALSEIFVRNKKEGDNIAIGCWINETVQLIKK